MGDGADRTVDPSDKMDGTGLIKYVAQAAWGVGMSYISETPIDISSKSYIEFDLYVENGQSIFYEATLAGINITSGANPDVEAVSYNINFKIPFTEEQKLLNETSNLGLIWDLIHRTTIKPIINQCQIQTIIKTIL